MHLLKEMSLVRLTTLLPNLEATLFYDEHKTVRIPNGSVIIVLFNTNQGDDLYRFVGLCMGQFLIFDLFRSEITFRWEDTNLRNSGFKGIISENSEHLNEQEDRHRKA